MQGVGHVTHGLAPLSWPVYGDTGLNMHVCGQEMHDCNNAVGTSSNVSVKKKDLPPLVPFLQPSSLLHWSCLCVLVCSCACEQGSLSDIAPLNAMSFSVLDVFALKW